MLIALFSLEISSQLKFPPFLLDMGQDQITRDHRSDYNSNNDVFIADS